MQSHAGGDQQREVSEGRGTSAHEPHAQVLVLVLAIFMCLVVNLLIQGEEEVEIRRIEGSLSRSHWS